MWSLSRRKARPAVAATRRLSPPPRLEALEERFLLNAGGLDTTFNPSGSPPGTATIPLTSSADKVLVQPSGNIVLLGSTNNSKGIPVFAAVELNPNGSLNMSFGSNGEEIPSFSGKWQPQSVTGAVLYPSSTGTSGDEKILAVGAAVSRSSPTAFALVRYNANGSLDTSFGTGGLVVTPFSQGSAEPAGVVLVPNGTSQPKILLVGDNHSGFELARYNPDGSLDTTFGSGGTQYIPYNSSPGLYTEAVALDPVTGDLVVAGETGQANVSQEEGLLAALKPTYNAQGAVTGYGLDTSFGTGGIATNGSITEQKAVAVQANGNIVVVGFGAGPANYNGSTDTFEVARYTTSGALDTTFGGTGQVSTSIPGSSSSVGRTVAIQSDGKIVAGGWMSPNSGGEQLALIRYNTDGSLDSTFGTGGITTTAIGSASQLYGMALEPNGDILAAGATNNHGDWVVARYLASPLQIGSFTATPSPATAGSSVTLTASNITDDNPNATITGVTFYYYDQSGNKVTLGAGTQTSPGVWTLTNSTAFGLTAGTYKIYTQATDSSGLTGDPASLSLTVS